MCILLGAAVAQCERIAGDFAVETHAREGEPDEGIEPMQDEQNGGEPV